MASLPPKVSTSFLTDEDLDTASFPDLHPVPSTSSDTLCDVNTGTGRPRRVSFCPLALLYTCAPDGEKDEVLASRDRVGRPRIGVRTYSVDAANIQASSRKAWGRVVSSISASFQPVFALEHANGYGVASFSSRSAPEEHDYFPANVPGSYCRENDEAFMPNHNRVSIKLPSLSRQRPRRQSTSDAPRSILKSPDRPSARPLASPPISSGHPIPLSSSPAAIMLPLVNSPSDLTPAAASPLAFAASPPLSPRLQDATHLAHLLSVPITPCCPHCVPGAEYGVCDDWKEHFSRSARRKRKEDAKEIESGASTTLEEKIKSGAITSESLKEKKDVGADDDEDVPFCVGPSRLGRANVDEIGCSSIGTIDIGTGKSSGPSEACPRATADEADAAGAPELVAGSPASTHTPPKPASREVYVAPIPKKVVPTEPKRKFSFVRTIGDAVEASFAASQAGAGGRAFP